MSKLFSPRTFRTRFRFFRLIQGQSKISLIIRSQNVEKHFWITRLNFRRKNGHERGGGYVLSKNISKLHFTIKLHFKTPFLRESKKRNTNKSLVRKTKKVKKVIIKIKREANNVASPSVHLWTVDSDYLQDIILHRTSSPASCPPPLRGQGPLVYCCPVGPTFLVKGFFTSSGCEITKPPESKEKKVMSKHFCPFLLE